jgi:hypothetical protein
MLLNCTWVYRSWYQYMVSTVSLNYDGAKSLFFKYVTCVFHHFYSILYCTHGHVHKINWPALIFILDLIFNSHTYFGDFLQTLIRTIVPLYYLNICHMPRSIFSLLLWCPFPEIVYARIFLYCMLIQFLEFNYFFHFTHNLNVHCIYVVYVHDKYEAINYLKRLCGRFPFSVLEIAN